jgi:hypothetical protein
VLCPFTDFKFSIQDIEEDNPEQVIAIDFSDDSEEINEKGRKIRINSSWKR